MGKTSFRNWIITKVGASMLKDLLTLKWFQGNRTKVAAVVIAVLTLLLNLGTITSETYSSIVGFLTAVGLLTASVHRPR